MNTYTEVTRTRTYCRRAASHFSNYFLDTVRGKQVHCSVVGPNGCYHAYTCPRWIESPPQ